MELLPNRTGEMSLPSGETSRMTWVSAWRSRGRVDVALLTAC